MDFMVAKLTGHKWIKTFNQQANSTGVDSRIASPNLGFKSHLFKNDNSVGAKGKIEFEHFLKLLEMIAQKLYPDQELPSALEFIIAEKILKIEKLAQAGPSRKTVVDYLINLMEILKDQNIVKIQK